MEKQNEVLTMREKMENVLKSAAEALMAGASVKTVTKQLNGIKLKPLVSNGFQVTTDDNRKYYPMYCRIAPENEIENVEQSHNWDEYDRKMMVYLLSFGYNRNVEIEPEWV